MFDGANPIVSDDELEFISLLAGDQSFCLELHRVREIRRWEPVTILPHAPSYILGVVNLRGAVVPIVDLAQKLGFQRIQPTNRNVIIISKYERQVIGFLVESVSEIFTKGRDEVKETPSISGSSDLPFIQGVISQEEDMIRIINIDALMSFDSEIKGGEIVVE